MNEYPHSKEVPSTVLVTGGSGTIGRAVSLRFAKEHWRVGVHHRTKSKEAQETVQDIRNQGEEGLCFCADVTDSEQVKLMIQALKSQWGRLDSLVCTTGVTVDKLLVRLAPEEWIRVMETNLSGIFFCLREAGSVFLTQGDGSVVIVGSLSSVQGSQGQVAYGASKAGLLGLVKTVSREWGASNIRINLVFPGWQESNLSQRTFLTSDSLDNHVLKRTPNLEEAAKAIYHVAQLTDVSGQVFNLDNRIW